MAYNRLPYQQYADTDPNQPYPLGYQADFPPQQIPYNAYPYPMNPYGDPSYTTDYPHPPPPQRRDGYNDFPSRLDYDEGPGEVMSLDPTSERPRESWTERSERAASPSYKRDIPPDDRPRRGAPPATDPYRRRNPDRGAQSHKNLDPYTLTHIVPFTYFCDWYKQANARTLPRGTEISKDELQDSFIKYRDDLLSRTAKDFVKEHEGDAWFKEKYDPTVAGATKAKRIEYRKWLYGKFMADLDAGQFDELTLDGAAGKPPGTGEGELIVARRYFSEKNGEASSPAASKKDDDDAESPATLAKMPQDPMASRRTPCIKTISTTVPRTQLEAVTSRSLKNWKLTEGQLIEEMEGFKYLSVSDPNPNKKFARVGWVIVDDSGDPDQIVRVLDNQRIHDDIYGDFTVHCAIHTSAKEQPRKALSDNHSTEESLKRDLKLAELCATKKFEAELGEGFNGLERIKERVKSILGTGVGGGVGGNVDEEDEEGVVKEDNDGLPNSLEEVKKVLDLTVEYFRRVYSFCFYCISENDSVHELQRKCFAGHFRRPPPETPTDSKTSRSTSILLLMLDKAWTDKMNLFVNPEELDVTKFGGVNVDELLKKEIEGAITREADDRWRCGVRKCTKLFLEEKFVRSHIQKRHKDWLERISLEAQLVNNYVLDPCRVLPTAVEQPPSGFGVKHFPEKEHGGGNRYEPTVIPTFTAFPQFSGVGAFDAPDFPMGGYGNGAPMYEPRGARARRPGPGGPMRRGMDGGRDHPYERRGDRRFGGAPEGFAGAERMRGRETRPLRSYRDLDAPQEATPELNY